MISVVQRVQHAQVTVGDEVVGRIGHGLMVLVGVARGDTEADVEATVRKLVALRMFAGKTPMDLTIKDVNGEVLAVSQFTLVGRLYKGNRPSFDSAEAPERANALYELFVSQLRGAGVHVQTGRFGADMLVTLANDGPVTFIIETAGGALVKRDVTSPAPA
ncbi:MAG: D-aminoacyl-tRNA deacylase [Deltaproteobacteria bacterium]|nr:D-aminoacyl-tRNA deacylase [Deltaproteobacteria bacterium]